MYLRCPKCDDKEARISAHIHEPGNFYCHECDESITTDELKDWFQEIKSQLIDWERVIEWAGKCPQ